MLLPISDLRIMLLSGGDRAAGSLPRPRHGPVLPLLLVAVLHRDLELRDPGHSELLTRVGHVTRGPAGLTWPTFADC